MRVLRPVDPGHSGWSSDASTGAASVPPATARAEPATGGLEAMRAADLWQFFTRQSAAYWLVCLYLFFEYVRPQSIYPALEGLPWALGTIVLCGVAFLFEGARVRESNLADGALALFTSVVVLSIVFARDPSYSLAYLDYFFPWLIVYFLISNLVTTRRRWLLFLFLFLLFSLKMSQHATRSWFGADFQFRTWGVTGAPGWFQNSGEFAIQMTIFVPLAFYFILALRDRWPQWKTWLMIGLPVSGLIGVLASSSRGGQLGMAAVILVMTAKARKKSQGLLLLALVAAVGWVMLPETQKERFSAAGEDETSRTRLTYWEHGREIAADFPAFGIGFKNWLPYYQEHYNPDGEVPHNIFIEAMAELGYSGLVALFFVVFATFRLNRRTRRLARAPPRRDRFLEYMAHGLDAGLVGYLVSGFFVTVLYYPFLWINLAMTSALYAVARRERKLRHPSRASARPRSAARGLSVAAPAAPAAGPVRRIGTEARSRGS